MIRISASRRSPGRPVVTRGAARGCTRSAARGCTRSAARGFTLLEVLVVLAITSMLSVLLIDGVTQVLMIERRMGANTTAFREDYLQEVWLRQVLSGALASNDHPLEMNGERIAGLTLAPLAGDQGVPTPFELLIVSTATAAELHYREFDEATVTLARWPLEELDQSPRFLAVSADGTYSTTWVSKEGGPQWPTGLALSTPLLDEQRFWHMAIPGRRTPRVRVTDGMGI